MDPRALDDIIERLIWNDDNQLTEQDIRDLCARATVIFLDEPSLIDFNLEGDPIKICGDIHGQFSDLLQIFNYGGHPSATNNYLFLGNYVDGGEQSVETVCLLLAYKIRYPENFFLLRGNHEIADINRNRGFYDECKSKFSRRLWRVFNDCFNCLPVAALIDEKIFCVHAGLSPCLNDLTQIENIRRPTDVPEDGLLCDLLWSDPSKDVQGWAMNISRGCSYTFGQDIVSQFLQKHDLDHIIRAHEVVADGYEFFGDGQLVTVYSAPNYCGEGNAGAIITIDESLLCSFQVLKPEEEGTNFNFSLTGETGTSDFTGEPVAGVKLLQPSNNKEMRWGKNFPPPAELVLPTSGGYRSTSRRKSEDTRVKPSFRAFSPKEIQDATNNFSESLIIGHTGYGKIYECQLDNWDVAVKILNDQSDQGDKEYVKEKEVLEVMRHENIIHLMGTCFIFRALVYEYLPNGSLEDCLKDRPWELTWKIRTRIVYEICTALRFLHANKPPLVHGDLNPHSVLLGADFKVKLADFGLCHYLTQGENSKAFCQTVHASGSPGYMDPDYLDSGKVTSGVDVYSFGKTVVRILTGQYPPDIFSEVHAAKRRGSFMSIVDPTVRDWPEDVVETLARFALRSIKPDRNRSEFMGNFHSELEMLLDENLLCSFQVMTPKEEGTNFNFSITRTSETGKPVAGVKPHQPSDNKEMKRGENFPPPTTGGYGSTFRRKSKDTRVKPSFKPFSPEEIQDATNNFSESLLIGKGGYGKVYKCKLDNWDAAVKILDDKSDQGLKEYIKEMEVLERMKHENLIHLMGTCFKFRALVYEYLPNGSLEDYLNDRPEVLTWEIRTCIVYEICTALRFLHANKPEPLVHGDLKPQNVLLGAKFKVKLADFGLCRYLTQGENSKAFRQTMYASGSPGYMDPDYLGSGKATSGVDVYSLGKTVVRILTGQHPPDIFSEVHAAKRRGSFMSIVDPTVRDWPEDVVDTLARFALRSIKPDRNRSEFMGNFHSELEMILDGIDN